MTTETATEDLTLKSKEKKPGATITGLAQDYGLSASYLYRLAHENKLPVCRRLGYRFVCLREEFEAWLRSGRRD